MQTSYWFNLQALFHYHSILGLYSITDYKVLLRDVIDSLPVCVLCKHHHLLHHM